MKLFTGNQVGALLVDYVIKMNRAQLNEKSTVIKTKLANNSKFTILSLCLVNKDMNCSAKITHKSDKDAKIINDKNIVK